jgi:hypothetical protein
MYHLERSYLYFILGSQGPTAYYPRSSLPFPSLGLFQLPLRSESKRDNALTLPYLYPVNPSCEIMAICHCHLLCFS